MPSTAWLVIAACALPGFALLIWSLRGDRARGRKRCPHCWYDMSASTSLTCPECGRTCASAQQLLRTRRRWKLALIALALIVGLPTGVSYTSVIHRIRTALTPKWSLIQEIKSGKYTIRHFERDDREMKAVEICYQNTVIARREQLFLTLGGENRYNGTTKLPFGLAQDITGDGVPDIIVRESTGGSSCDARYTVYSLADPPDEYDGFRPLAVFEWCGYWDDLDHDGRVEFVAYDSTYDYRWTSNAGSPRPRVIFRVSNYYGGVMASDLMLEPLTTPEQLADLVAEARATSDRYGEESLDWQTFFDLVYSGNEDAAWQFYEQAYDPARFNETKIVTRKELEEALAESPFYLAIKGLQNRSR